MRSSLWPGKRVPRRCRRQVQFYRPGAEAHRAEAFLRHIPESCMGMRQRGRVPALMLFFSAVTAACSPDVSPAGLSIPAVTVSEAHSPVPPVHGEWASVVRAIGGDMVGPGTDRRVRCLGLNIPERDRLIHEEAKEANRQLLEGRLALLELDVIP